MTNEDDLQAKLIDALVEWTEAQNAPRDTNWREIMERARAKLYGKRIDAHVNAKRTAQQ